MPTPDELGSRFITIGAISSLISMQQSMSMLPFHQPRQRARQEIDDAREMTVRLCARNFSVVTAFS